jgi:hypothetical protein
VQRADKPVLVVHKNESALATRMSMLLQKIIEVLTLEVTFLCSNDTQPVTDRLQVHFQH